MGNFTIIEVNAAALIELRLKFSTLMLKNLLEISWSLIIALCPFAIIYPVMEKTKAYKPDKFWIHVSSSTKNNNLINVLYDFFKDSYVILVKYFSLILFSIDSSRPLSDIDSTFVVYSSISGCTTENKSIINGALTERTWSYIEQIIILAW